MKQKIYLITYFSIILALTVFIILFAKDNSLLVQIHVLSKSFTTQLWIALISSFFIGVFIALSVSLYYILAFKLRLSKLSKMAQKETEINKNLFQSEDIQSQNTED